MSSGTFCGDWDASTLTYRLIHCNQRLISCTLPLAFALLAAFALVSFPYCSRTRGEAHKYNSYLQTLAVILAGTGSRPFLDICLLLQCYCCLCPLLVRGPATILLSECSCYWLLNWGVLACGAVPLDYPQRGSKICKCPMG